MSDTKHPILTIGYEGASPESVIAALGAAGARTLIDVRDLPRSRKPGFSAKALKATVEAAGMDYVGLPALGVPREGREAAKAGRRDAFERIYEARLASAEGIEALGVATLIARHQGPAGLLCFERDPRRCHRAIAAQRLAARLGVPVHHLEAAIAKRETP